MDFDADITTVDTGVWQEFDDAEFLIAHISNLKFQRALARLQQPHRRKLENGTLDPQVNRDILCKAMAEGVLLDWRKVGSKETGAKDVPYSAKAGQTMLIKNAEFRDFVSAFAVELANFKQAEVEALGNS